MISDIKKLAVGVVALVSVAAVTLIGIAVVTQFKSTNLVDNTTADNFITGLALFGTFGTLLSITLLGTVVIKMFKGGDIGSN